VADGVPLPTFRQCQIATLLATEGLGRDEIAARLNITRKTVDSQLGKTRTPGLIARVGGRTSLDVVRWYWAEGGRAVCERQEGP
jgi:DNA-binding HxlR family transcriptional regulator